MARPKEGDTTIKEGNKFVFRNGQWIKAANQRNMTRGKRTGSNKSVPQPIPQSQGTKGRGGQGGGRGSAAAANRSSKPKYQAPKEGDTTVKEGNTFVFNNGQWVLPPKAPKLPTPKEAAAGAPKPATSKPAPKPAATASKPASTPTPKPISSAKPAASKPAGKTSSAKETYRDGGKGLYQGTEDYRAKVGGSGNPLLNRFRQDMGRDVATGMKTGGGNNNYNTPDQKSQYVASNGQPYAGPAFGEGKSSNSGKLAKAMEDQRKKREEERKRLMASRKGTSWGGVG